jgi:hypothetical protein
MRCSAVAALVLASSCGTQPGAAIPAALASKKTSAAKVITLSDIDHMPVLAPPERDSFMGHPLTAEQAARPRIAILVPPAARQPPPGTADPAP